jgi:hypothetical protein
VLLDELVNAKRERRIGERGHGRECTPEGARRDVCGTIAARRSAKWRRVHAGSLGAMRRGKSRATGLEPRPSA